MSVVMTLRVVGDGTATEKLAAEDPTLFTNIVDRARDLGVISHRFYASDNEILVVDEWPSPEAFQHFFDENAPEIQKIMKTAGVTSEPEITFWRKLDTGDDVG